MGLLKARGAAKDRVAWLTVCLALTTLCCGKIERAEREGATPQRIIALAPSVTETLFELGLGERVVGVGDYSVWPPQVQDLPHLGGLFDVRLETIATLRPDLAVLIPSEEELARRLEQLGVSVLMVGSDTLADVEMSFTRIAERCHVPQAGEDLVLRWRQGFDLPPLESPDLEPPVPVSPIRVMLSVGRRRGDLAGVLVAGPGTYFDEMLQLMGATNVFADAPVTYPEIGLEEILRRRPEAIVELQTEFGDTHLLVADWDSLAEIPAVRDGCIPVISGTHVMVPGPRLPQLFEEIRAALESCGRSS